MKVGVMEYWQQSLLQIHHHPISMCTWALASSYPLILPSSFIFSEWIVWTCVSSFELINNWNEYIFVLEFGMCLLLLLILSRKLSDPLLFRLMVRSTILPGWDEKIRASSQRGKFALIQLCRNKYLTSSRIPIKWNIHEGFFGVRYVFFPVVVSLLF